MYRMKRHRLLCALVVMAMVLTLWPAGVFGAMPADIQIGTPLDTSEETKPGEVTDSDTPVLDVGPSADTTPPAFAADYPKYVMQGPGSRMLGIVINAQEEAYHYLVVLPDGAAAPNSSQVAAGTDGDGQPALTAQKSVSNKYSSIQTSASVPDHNTAYDVYVVLKDDAGNLSEPALLNVTAPPAAQLITGDGIKWTMGDPGTKQGMISIKLQNIDTGRKGKVYWVLLPDGSAQPSIEQIADGRDGDGNAAVSAGSPEFDPADGEGHFPVTGAAGSTLYDLYLVVGHTRFANPLAECTGVEMMQVTTPADIEGEKVCAIGSTEYESLGDALNAVASGSTAAIKLLKTINSTQGIEIANKSITLDLNGFDLNINTTANEGLKVTDGTVAFAGSGAFNVTGKNYGVWAERSTVTVTNASASDTNTSMTSTGMGVYARGGSKVTVRQNAFGAAHGVKAENLGTEVTVEGSVSSSGSIKGAVYSLGQAKVTVKGNVTATAGYGVHAYGGGSITVEKDVSGNHIGAYAEDVDVEIIIKGNLISANNGAVIGNTLGSGSITVDGEIKGYGANPSPTVAYVNINGKKLARTDGVSDAAKPGYLKYSGGDKPGVVWVKDVNSSTPGGPTGPAVWHNRAPLPTANFINRVRYLDGEYIAVGEKGTLQTSSNGEDWHKIIVGEGLDRLGGIAYGGGKYVTVGHVDYIAGRIFTFDNVTGWHQTAAEPNLALHDVAYGNGKFVAVGGAGKILTSADGENWTTHSVTYPTGKETTLLSITYAADKGLFVASGMGSATNQHKGGIMSSPDGITWTVAYSDPNFTLWDITYGNGKFVAVGSTNNGSCCIVTSSDCVNWNQPTPASYYPSLYAVVWDGTRFIAAGVTGGLGYNMVSTDGTNWSSRPEHNGTSGFRTLAYGASRLVAMGGYGNIYTSDDAGTTWNCRTLGGTKTLNDVAYNGVNLYVAVGVEGRIQISSNGSDWTIQDSKTTETLNKVDFLGDQFIAVGKNGTILTSKNGADWTQQTSGTTRELKGISNGSGWYVAVGGDQDSNPVVLYSTNGTAWTNVDMTGVINRSFVSVAYGNGVFLAMMNYGQCYKFQKDTDTNEFLVTRVTDLTDSGNYPKDIIYAGDHFVAIGGYGKVWQTSNKGANWSFTETKPDSYSHSVAYSGGNLVAVGDMGMIKASADGGATWRLQPSGLTPNHYDSNNYIRLNGATAGNNCFVAVGENGLVLQSESFTVSDDTDAHDVDVAARKLYFGHFQGPGSNGASGIVADMNLFTTWDEGTNVSWVSSKPQYIATSGTVTRPAFRDGDQAVQLTATISKNSASISKSFVVVVKAVEDPDINFVNAAVAALTFDTIKGANSASNNITSNLNLPTTGENSTTIGWISDNAAIAANGTVTRPAEGSPDTSVTLTATVSKGAVVRTKTFNLTVKAQMSQNAQDVAAAKAALTFDTIKAGNSAANNITSNLNLIITGANGTAIVWGSSKPSTIATDGTVTRPAQGAADETVTLTATIAKWPATDTKSFTLTVKAQISQDAQDVAAAIAALDFDTIRGSNIEAESITSNLTLPVTGANSTAISWASSNPAAIATGGMVTRPAQGTADEDVILTATISKGAASQTKQFTVRVKAMPSAPTPGGSPGSSSGTSVPRYEATVTGGDSSTKNEVKVDTKTGSASTELSAAQSGQAADGKNIVVDIPKISGVTSNTLGIPVSGLSKDNGNGSITLKTAVGSVTLPTNMLFGTDAASGSKGQISIGAVKSSDLSKAAQDKIGNHPVISLSLSIDGKAASWDNPNASVTVSIPYTPAAEELKNPEGITVWYIDGAGKLTKVSGAKYNPATKTVAFTTTHFSYYAVGYQTPASVPAFADTAKHWAKDNIDFVVGRGLLSGTSASTFAPNTAITRSDFLMALGKLSGVDVSGYKTSSFTDINSAEPAMPYIEWAVKNKIVQGIGNNKFGPEMQITREQMAVMMVNYAEAAGNQMPVSQQAVTFADDAKINSWSKEAVKVIQQAGIMQGKGNSIFDPQGSATRAEASTILRRFAELAASL